MAKEQVREKLVIDLMTHSDGSWSAYTPPYSIGVGKTKLDAIKDMLDRTHEKDEND